MKLEKQVCSLELAKRLKELGVKQNGLYSWIDYDDSETVAHLAGVPADGDKFYYSAFTVAELGEMIEPFVFSMRRNGGEFVCADYMMYRTKEFGHHIASTEADARAKMLIYLLEHKLLGGPSVESNSQ